MTVFLVARVVVALAFGYASIVALTYWAVRTKRLNPVGGWSKFVRRLNDPVIVPLERRLARGGRNPQDAAWWLLGIVLVGGLIGLSLLGWLSGLAFRSSFLVQSGLRGWLFMAVRTTYFVLSTALIIRVIASWFGIGAYRSWMRPVLFLTDWMVRPIRRLLPPTGMFDFSPVVAWLLLFVAQSLLLSLVMRLPL